MAVVNRVLRLFVGACLSVVILYCGTAMMIGMLTGRMLPAFPFSWVDWLNRPNVPPLLDHVINFLVMSMAMTLFQSTGRQKAPARGARRSSAF